MSSSALATAEGPPSPSASPRLAPASGATLHRYMPALDGLRALAILWVISLHLPGQMAPLGNPLTRRGAFGVELFFAISGFLVTRSLQQCVAREQSSGGGRGGSVLRDFFVRRVARIWPPYFLAVGIFVLALALSANFRERSNVMGILWTFPTFLANYAIPYHEPPLSMLAMWSLCFEEQFYVLLILMYLLGGARIAPLIVASAAASIVLRLGVAAFRPEIFSKLVMQMQLHWRFDALAWGCLAWIFHRPIQDFWMKIRHRQLLEILIVVAAVAACTPGPAGPMAQAVTYLVMGPAFAALVAALAFSPGFWLAKVLSWRPFVFVGVISYEIYLSHVAVYRALAALHLDPSSYVYMAACVGASIAAAWALHSWFSKPTQRWIRSAFEPRRG